MLKKVVVGTLLAGLIGVLIFGAINRTLDRTGKVAEARGTGRAWDEPNGRGDSGQNGARGGRAEQQYPNGQTLTLRDETGRPAWAGERGGRGQEEVPGDQTGTGQAQVETWLQIQGAVVSVDADALIVQTADGEQIAVENRPWWFAQETGFWAQVGNQLTLTGFYKGDEFEVGRIDDITSGQTVLLRDENGRPMWAGRGQRGA
jgi:hypothetical protein